MSQEKPAPNPTPTHIGPYHILDTLGEGGMGTVYLCEQREPVRRRVALKVIKLGMDSKAVLARFDAERQALSMMEHSCVARIHDAGVTDKGQPYFAMEYVKGIPITHYCDENKLGLDQRIELFRKVCSGVQHAHLKGVMHRDLKPGNVLVTVQDGKPIPKIIDFGLAKAMDHRLVQATVFTQQGQVIGTPEYMSPEQAGLGGLDVDTRTDVYSLGVLLYELLTGELPFSRQELQRAGLLEMQRILKETDAPKPSTKIISLGDAASENARMRGLDSNDLKKRLRGDLDWIVLRALEKDRTRRYETALELAGDLERHFQHLPVLASPPGLGYRVKKFVRRYRVQCAAAALVFATILAGGIGTYLQYLRAEDNAMLANQRAEENARLAASEQKAKEEAQGASLRLAGKVREFDQLAGVVLHDRVVKAEETLYPAWPDQATAMEQWLRGDAGRLLAMQPDIERTVRDLQARAMPATAAELEADRRSHARFTEFEAWTRRVGALRRAHAIRGGQPLVVPELPAEIAAQTAHELNDLAWKRVAPPVQAGGTEPRTVYGEETFALACARAAAAKAKDTPIEHQVLDTLAWALFANGQDAEAKQTAAAAFAKAPPTDRETYRGNQSTIEDASAKAGEVLATAEQKLAALTAAVNTRRTFRFELESQRFLHDTLAELLGKLDSLAGKQVAAVEQRLSWSKQIGELTLAHPKARHTWTDVRRAIASSEKYRGQGIELRDQDITGLVPIGMNPATKLWEFYELRSAWDGKSNPKDLAIPEHDAEGRIQVGDDTGIVFVLLPGGTLPMGSQRADPNGGNYDDNAEDYCGPVHAVSLAPFFLGRYELTQGQWLRLWSGDEALRQPSQYKAGMVVAGQKTSLANPVEQVDWAMCDLLLRQHGLLLPTEAQWEYGCRAGSNTPWLCPFELLGSYANVADATARLVTPWPCEEWEDGYVAHAPVGSFLANSFGLHDVHGNVFEWCRDEYGSYHDKVRGGDGLRLQGDGSNRTLRGGSFQNAAEGARSALRNKNNPSGRINNLGCRPARAVRL